MDANKIIDALGGTGAVAELCDVSSGAVSQWRTDGIPRARLMYLRLAKPKIFKALDAEYSGPERRTGVEPGQIMRKRRASNGAE